MRKTNQQDQAKQRLLKAAVKLFALQGFAGTTTRQIAAEAGSSLSMLKLHFDSKDGIYQAAIDHIVDAFLIQHFTVFRDIIEARESDPSNREKNWQLIRKLTDLVVDVVMNPELHYEALLLNRELQDEHQNFEKTEPLLMFFFNYELLFEAYTGAPAESVWAKQLSFSTISAVLSFIRYPGLLKRILPEATAEQQKEFARDYALRSIEACLKQHI